MNFDLRGLWECHIFNWYQKLLTLSTALHTVHIHNDVKCTNYCEYIQTGKLMAHFLWEWGGSRKKKNERKQREKAKQRKVITFSKCSAWKRSSSNLQMHIVWVKFPSPADNSPGTIFVSSYAFISRTQSNCPRCLPAHDAVVGVSWPDSFAKLCEYPL